MKWRLITEAPEYDGKKLLLCGFKGQFHWVYFVALANGKATQAPGFAKPTHFCEIDAPSE